jgi:hypothetical protein
MASDSDSFWYLGLLILFVIGSLGIGEHIGTHNYTRILLLKAWFEGHGLNLGLECHFDTAVL